MARHRLTHPPAHPSRRSQAERAEQMQVRLLDATIEILATRGYARMSTNDVVRRARVSRGALAHHFPTKADLVQAAAQRLIERRAADFRREFSAIAPERRTPAEALNVLWSHYDDPGGIAMIELTVASRSHPELQTVLGPMLHQIAESTTEIFAEFFPDLAQLPFASEALRAIHAMYAGLVLSSMAGGDADERSAEVRAFIKILASMSGQLTALLPVPTATSRSRS
jgi:AcrR family transcriptional regulator